ncbi:MAG TPA: cell division ATP-binding protein FtsE, partial [Bacteroidetes bacterium]|nr:cell division ATP-binding protein FtsE [Bacteroidota bacterium]
MTENPVVEFRDVSVVYEGKLVLDKINFKLHNGEFVYLIGQTGAGKSSFLKLIYRDVLPYEGKVFVDQTDISKMPSKQIPFLRRKLGIVFQDFQLLQDRNVYDNVA